jgi:electron transport complex protein RnfC
VSALLRDRTRELVEGVRIAMRILGRARAVLAVGETDRGVVPAFERAIDASPGEVGIAVVSSRYPQAHEGLLAAALGGRSFVERDPRAGGGHAAEDRTVVMSVATLLAVREAVCLDRPFIERVVTVSGSLVRSPRNLKARIGTRIGDLVEECGGCVEAPAAFILGGQMTGRLVESPDVPLTKSVSGVIALSAREARVPRARPCIGCGMCIDACPWGLEPSRLCKLLEHDRVDQALAEGLADCSLCGCCAFVCPSGIPLAGVLAAGPGANHPGAAGAFSSAGAAGAFSSAGAASGEAG